MEDCTVEYSTVISCSQQLRGKAAERNPDEFYFAMETSSTKDGVHVARCDNLPRVSILRVRVVMFH